MYATKRATSVNLFRSMYLVWYSLLAVVTDAQQSVRVDGVSCFIMRQQDTPPPLVGDLANGDTGKFFGISLLWSRVGLFPYKDAKYSPWNILTL